MLKKNFYVCPECYEIETLTDMVPAVHKHNDVIKLIMRRYYKEAKSLMTTLKYGGRHGYYGSKKGVYENVQA